MRSSTVASPALMLLSAAIFGYFGFAMSYSHTGVQGQFLFFVALFDWTLKVAAVSFLICGLITFVRPMEGSLLYGVLGGLAAISFIIVAILDVADQQHMIMHPILLVIFAGWNAYASWSGISDALAARTEARDDTAPPPP